MKKALALLAAGCLCAAALPQQKPVPAPVDAVSPVSRDEVRASLTRLRKTLEGRTTIKFRPFLLPAGTAPATRAEIAFELNSMFTSLEPVIRWTRRPPRSYDAILKERNKDPRALSVMQRLVRFGLAGPVGPLVVGPKDSLTPRQLGDALGFAFAQFAAMLHQPDPKWTPDLQKP